jgi:hypothetical protein
MVTWPFLMVGALRFEQSAGLPRSCANAFLISKKGVGHGVNTPLAVPRFQPSFSCMHASPVAIAMTDMGDASVAVAPQPTLDYHSPWPTQNPAEPLAEFSRVRARVLPDVAICRAKVAGFGDCADCLVENSYHCPHALSYGGGCFCQHPQRGEIIRCTLEREQVGAGRS